MNDKTGQANHANPFDPPFFGGSDQGFRLNALSWPALPNLFKKQGWLAQGKFYPHAFCYNFVTYNEKLEMCWGA